MQDLRSYSRQKDLQGLTTLHWNPHLMRKKLQVGLDCLALARQIRSMSIRRRPAKSRNPLKVFHNPVALCHYPLLRYCIPLANSHIPPSALCCNRLAMTHNQN